MSNYLSLWPVFTLLPEPFPAPVTASNDTETHKSLAIPLRLQTSFILAAILDLGYMYAVLWFVLATVFPSPAIASRASTFLPTSYPALGPVLWLIAVLTACLHIGGHTLMRASRLSTWIAPWHSLAVVECDKYQARCAASINTDTVESDRS
jgi:hypothetical protein